MTKAWRIVKASRSRDAFSGEGARRYGGRWNHAGTAVVYLADSPALAALEQFVHLGRAHATLSFVAFPVHIPDELIAVFDPRRLPANWRELPAPPETKEIGTGWVVSASSAVLKIPSVLVPVEHNYVLNPAHPDFDRIEIGKPEPFSFDPRMWK